MKNVNQKLIVRQVDKKLEVFTPLLEAPVPEKGWIHIIRTALKMSLRQFGDKLGISLNSAKHIEKREREKSITIKSLEEAGKALNMKLVYGFVPMDDSLEKSIRKRAMELAKEIVETTSATMSLEDQKNTEERLSEAIEEKAQELIEEMPRYLWG